MTEFRRRFHENRNKLFDTTGRPAGRPKATKHLAFGALHLHAHLNFLLPHGVNN